MKDIYTNSSSSPTRIYTALELVILSKLTYASNFEMHGSANMISFKYNAWKQKYLFHFFFEIAAEKKVSNEICTSTNTNVLPACSISNFLMSYWKNIWPRLELIPIRSDDILQ